MKLSVVISAYNEEVMIEECLKSVKEVADEVIVVNNSSSDKTEEISKKYAKVFTRPNDPVNLNRNKNFGFTKATGDWILSLDADERITPELAKEIRKTINHQPSTINGYDIPRKNIIFGKWIQHSIWWPDYNLRLFRKTKGKFAEKHVHEKLDLDGEVGKLTNPMVHYNYQTVSQFINKLNRTYTESEAENFINAGKHIYWFDAIRWPVNDFVKTFFFEKGYKDGMHGLVLSMFQAFYALVYFAKVWEKKENFKDLFTNTPPDIAASSPVIAIPNEVANGEPRQWRVGEKQSSPNHPASSYSHSELDSESKFLVAVIKEFQRASKDIRYWIFEALMDQNPTKKIYYKIRRKLK